MGKRAGGGSSPPSRPAPPLRPLRRAGVRSFPGRSHIYDARCSVAEQIVPWGHNFRRKCGSAPRRANTLSGALAPAAVSALLEPLQAQVPSDDRLAGRLLAAAVDDAAPR